MGGMIRAELVFYPADPATHPSRIETRHSSKTFLAKLNQTLSLNCLTYVKSTCQRLVWMVDVVDTTLNNVLLNNSKRVKQRSNKRDRQRQKQRQREGEREEHDKPTKLELNPQLERKWIYIPSTKISLTLLYHIRSSIMR